MGVSVHLRQLHRASYFRTNFRVLGRWGDCNWEVYASLRGTDQPGLSYGPFADFSVCYSERGFEWGKDLESRLPFPQMISEWGYREWNFSPPQSSILSPGMLQCQEFIRCLGVDTITKSISDPRLKKKWGKKKNKGQSPLLQLRSVWPTCWRMTKPTDTLHIFITGHHFRVLAGTQLLHLAV